MTPMTSEPSGISEARSDDSSAVEELVLRGELGLPDLPELQRRLAAWTAESPARIDLGKAERIDTSVAWAILDKKARLEAAGGRLEIEGAAGVVARILETVSEAMPVPEEVAKSPRGVLAWLTRVGEKVATGMDAFGGFLGVLGLFVARLLQTFVHPSQFRFTALVAHCEDVGLRAVPIVSLMSFLIGVVLAFQGAAQLQQFGAEIFVVDLIAISILRELGILLTAIIVAGRTASAFTAAIGSMKMRQEIDAMLTLGIDPGHALIVPRILALVLMLPILGLIANVAGLVGGGLMAWLELGISPASFVFRMIENTAVSNVTVGIVKAPVFAVLIGVIGCAAGLRVGSTAESLGRMTSSAVVAAIFSVILADAMFSVFFQRIDL